MIATTATVPVRSTSGAPVTEKAARIAEYVAAQEAYYRTVAQASTGTREDIAHLDAIGATIVNGSARYDYYNWLPA
jgi:hypothetical protein